MNDKLYYLIKERLDRAFEQGRKYERDHIGGKRSFYSVERSAMADAAVEDINKLIAEHSISNN